MRKVFFNQCNHHSLYKKPVKTFFLPWVPWGSKSLFFYSRNGRKNAFRKPLSITHQRMRKSEKGQRFPRDTYYSNEYYYFLIKLLPRAILATDHVRTSSSASSSLLLRTSEVQMRRNYILVSMMISPLNRDKRSAERTEEISAFCICL